MLIFLDIDGVMVPISSWKAPQILADGFPAFSPKAIQVMNSLVSDNVTIVLTTSHKSRYTLTAWKNIFNNRGIKVESMQRLGDNDNNFNRSEEILRWFNVNNINDEFVIIDDDTSLNSLPAYLKQHLVTTSSMIGLTSEYLPQINAILRKGIYH